MEAWREARTVARGVIELSRLYWKPYGSAVISQLQRSSLSVQLNIAEGFAYGDSATYTRFLGTAYGSAVETMELLELAADSQLFPADRSTELREHSRRAHNLLLALLKHRRRFSAK